MPDCVSLALVMRACSPVAEAFLRLREGGRSGGGADASAVLRLHLLLRSLDDACELSVELARRGRLPEALKAQSLAEEHSERVLAHLAQSGGGLAAALAALDWERVETVARDLRWYVEEDYRTVDSGRGNVDAFRELLTLVRRELDRGLYAEAPEASR